MPLDLPPAFLHEEIPRLCIIQTLQRYQIPPDLFIGYMGQENGRLGMANKNDNGSEDYGPAQVNSAWLKSIRTYGVTQQQLQWNPCVNIWVSGWIMRRCLNRYPGPAQFWTAVGCYHVGEYALQTDDTALRAKRIARSQRYAGLVYSKMVTYRQGFWQWLNDPKGYATMPSNVGAPGQATRGEQNSSSEVAGR